MKRKKWQRKGYTKSAVHKLKDKLFELVKKICRERMPCILKGVPGAGACGGNIHASHIKSEGAWKNLFLDPRNIFPMCYHHHFHFWHKDTTEWSKWFEINFAPIYAYLEVEKIQQHIDFNNPVTLSMLFVAAKKGYAEYADLYEEFRARALESSPA